MVMIYLTQISYKPSFYQNPQQPLYKIIHIVY